MFSISIFLTVSPKIPLFPKLSASTNIFLYQGFLVMKIFRNKKTNSETPPNIAKSIYRFIYTYKEHIYIFLCEGYLRLGVSWCEFLVCVEKLDRKSLTHEEL